MERENWHGTRDLPCTQLHLIFRQVISLYQVSGGIENTPDIIHGMFVQAQ